MRDILKPSLAGLAGLVSLFWGLSARAQDMAACPDTVEQSLFNMQLRLQTGQVDDGGSVYALANATLEHCADRDEAQGIAAELFTQVALSVETPQDRFLVWSKAYAAAVNNHNAFTHDASPIVKLPDGSDRTLYPYASVSKLMSEYIAKNLLYLALDEHTHPIFDKAALAECPYNENQGRLRDEIEGLHYAGIRNYERGGVALALRRIHNLKTVCAKQDSYITLILARSHGSAAYHAKRTHRADDALAHAEKSLNYYETFQLMDMTDIRDRDDKRGMVAALADARDQVADMKAFKASNPPPPPTGR